jgi:TonB family protein
MKKVLLLLLLSVSLNVFSQDKNIEEKLFKSAVKTKSAKLYLEYFENYYPTGKYIKKAQKKGNDIVFSEAVKNNDYFDLLKYKKYFLDRESQIKVNYELNRIADKDLKQVINSEKTNELITFINNHPDANKQISAARNRIKYLEDLAYEKCLKQNTFSSYYSFVQEYPESNYLNEIIDNLWELVKTENTFTEYSHFLHDTPSNEHKPQAEQLIKTAMNNNDEGSLDYDPDKPFTVVESMPYYSGGNSELYKFLAANIHYPRSAIEAGISGTVYVKFVVEKSGKVTDVMVARGIGGGCDEEAVRVVKMMPNWIPGAHRGIFVDVYFTLPIKFRLQ